MRFVQIFLLVIASVAASVGIVIGGVIAAPAIDSLLWPVLTESKLVTAVYDDEGWLTLDVLVHKQRNCQRISTGWLVGRPERYRHLSVRTARPTEDKGESPDEWFSLYPQHMDVRGAAPGDVIVGIAYHRCQNAWDVSSDLGPFEIPLPPTGEFSRGPVER